MVEEAIPKSLRYKQLSNTIDGCHSGDQSLVVGCIFGIHGGSTLDGFSTVGVGCLMLLIVYNCECGSLF